MNWHIFCEVVDNFGDIGVCWRLAKQLSQQHSQQVSLWVDDLISFQALCPAVDTQQTQQCIDGINIIHWLADLPAELSLNIQQAQVVIEAFGCQLPNSIIEQMQQAKVSPLWLNLEYLTAESWAEDCHLLPSPQQRLTKIFFFPGFTEKTGGLLWEDELLNLADQMQTLEARQQLFGKLGIAAVLAEIPMQISLFAYENKQVAPLLSALNQNSPAVHLLVPQGRVQQEVEHWLANHELNNLTVSIIPFMPQPTYDRLLATCQLNFVRGEESFVRAQMLGLPMIWHIYPQQENAHIIKLNAFLEQYLVNCSEPIKTQLTQAFLIWNEAQEAAIDWSALLNALPNWQAQTSAWQRQQIAHQSLAQNLVQFAQTRYSARHF